MLRRIHSISLLCALLIGSAGMNYVQAQTTYSGKCGANLTFNYNLGVTPSSLSITGTGAMYNYNSGSQYPWYNHVGTYQWVHNNYRSLTIGSGVTTIGDYAFYESWALLSVSFPSTLKSIGKYAFYQASAGSTNVTPQTITIPNSVTSLGVGAFYKYKNLKTLTIGTGVTAIPDSCFMSCDSLTTLSLPNKLKTIGSKAFMYARKLKSVTIPSSVTTIGEAAFSMCTELTSLTISNGVKTIGPYAFSGCNKLTTLVIPSSVTSLGDWSLNCSGLTDVYFSWTSNIPQRPANCLDFNNKNTKIHIPCGTEELYRAKGWFDYATPVSPTYYTLTVKSANSSQGKVRIENSAAVAATTLSVGCSEKATMEAVPSTGYHFTKWNDNNTSNPRTVTVSAAVTYTAYFAINTYTLTVKTATGNTTQGTVRFAGGAAGSSASQTFNYNDGVNIIATPATGYHFVKWDDGNTNANRTVTVTGNKTYTATFATNTYTITFKNENGTTLQTKTVNHGVVPTYTGSTPTKAATAQYTYSFKAWSPTPYAANKDQVYTATYNQTVRSYTITANTADASQGTVTGGGTYNYNATATLTATPTECHHFVRWTDGNTSNPRTVTVKGAKTYTAVFETTQYTVTVQTATGDDSMGDVSVTVNP